MRVGLPIAAGFQLEATDVIRLEVIGPDDICDMKTDVMFIGRNHLPLYERDTLQQHIVGVCHANNVHNITTRACIGRICDTGDIVLRVKGTWSMAGDDGAWSYYVEVMGAHTH